MKIWKRVIILVVVFMVLLSCLVFPASAASEDDFVSVMQESGLYYFSPYGDASYQSTTVNHVSNTNHASLNWTLDVPIFCNYVYFTIECGRVPDNLTFRINYGNTYTSEYLGSKGNYHYYRQAFGSYIQIIDLDFYFSVNSYSGHISLVTAFCIPYDSYSFSGASVYTQDLLYFAGSDNLCRRAYENKVAYSMPMEPFNHITNFINEPVDPLLNGVVWVYNTSDQMPFVTADKLTYSISLCGSVGEEGFSFFLVDSNGDPYYTVPAISVYSLERDTNIYFGSDAMQWPIYEYTITVDVSGLDLSAASSFGLNFWIDPVDVYFDSWTGWYCRINAITAKPTIIQQPWYTRFGRWINSGFDRVVDALGGGDQSNSLSNAGQQMKEDAGAISSAGDSLGAVSQPDVDSGALINNYVNFDPVGLSVLSCITSNPMVTSMLVVVFTFCLAGYIFFGKKR